jgi:hypothetical protein
MVANYAVSPGTYTLASGAVVCVLPGEKRDSVTDAAEIAIWASNWSATPPTAVSSGIFNWLAVYPRGTV